MFFPKSPLTIPNEQRAIFHTNNIATYAPLPDCSYCLGDMFKSMSNSCIQIPVQAEVSSCVPSWNFSSGTGYPRLRRLGENSLIEGSVDDFPLYQREQYNYLPTENRNRRLEWEERRRRALKKSKVGLEKWYYKKQQERLEASLISQNKIRRTQKVLKRLQNNRFMRQWKLEKRFFQKELESIRQSKLDVLRKKGIKTELKTECPLWNCPRKEYKRKRPFMTLDPLVRSASRLSNLSRRSRSPIIFQRTE